jgi:AmiR/NasT family two-component response regulator
MAKKTVLIISEHPRDFGELSAVLARAGPAPFELVTVDTRDQPVAALMDAGNDAVILAYSPETEYLLRLARKKNLALPIIALVDEESESLLNKLNEAGATDHILRDQIGDNRLFNKLDSGLGMDALPQEHDQDQESNTEQETEQETELGKEQEKEREQRDPGPDAEQARPLTGEATTGVDRVTPAVETSFEPQPTAEPTPARSNPALKHTAKVTPLALAMSSAFAAPWKVSIVATIAALVLVSANQLSQRLDSESRLARLEASNDLLSRQLSQLHSDLTQIALAPASPGVVVTAPGTVVATRAAPAPVSAPEPATRPAEDQPAVGSASAQVTQEAAPPPESGGAAQLASPVATTGPTTGPDNPEQVAMGPITPITEAGDDRWFINLGTFSSRGGARRFANSLGASSHKREIHGVVVAGKSLYRVRVVDLPSVEVAEALAMDYQITLGGGRPWVGQD